MKIRLPSRMKFNYLLQSFIFNQAYVISQGVPWISKRPAFEYVANLDKYGAWSLELFTFSLRKKGLPQSFLFYGPHFFFSFHSKSILTWKSHSQKIKKKLFFFEKRLRKWKNFWAFFVLSKLEMCFSFRHTRRKYESFWEFLSLRN